MPGIRKRALAVLLCASLAGLYAVIVQPSLAADPVFVGAGDIAECATTGAAATANLLDGIEGTIFTTGDNAYDNGTSDEFNNCYNPTWGRHKARTRPTPGNHDYASSGASPYYTYFGANAGNAGVGYYSYDLGTWHVIALNSEIDASVTSPQAQWLRGDLATHQSICTIAYWHKPIFSSGTHGNDATMRDIWTILYEQGVDIVLNGHDHDYERFAPQNQSGQADPRGIREFVVGTGGAHLRDFSTLRPNSEVRNSSTWGVMKLTLHASSYDWQFVPVAGQTYSDAGSAACVSGTNPQATTPATTVVAATVETAPMPHSGDSADDPAIWVHPSNPALSTVIGTDKLGGLAVYDLAGAQIQYLPDGNMNNVDVRYNFPLDDQRVALVTAGNRTNNSIAIYRVNPATRMLENVAARTITPNLSIYGSCMYHSPVTGKYYLFINAKSGAVEQWELFGTSGGKVDAFPVRGFSVGSQTEGCVADDELGAFYIGEEAVGVWKYTAEPTVATTRTLVDSTGAGGRLTSNVEGLTLYYAEHGTGYLIVSSQGSDTYVAYQREAPNAYVTTFAIGAGNGIDGTSNTDGIDVTNFSLGSAFPQGVFVAQDGSNDNGNQNFKLVPWQAIASAASQPLTISTTRDPRQVGAGNASAPISLSPASASAGGPGFSLIVNGDGFASGSIVRWNGTDRPTRFISSTQLSAEIPASDLATAGAASVSVVDPAPNGGTSSAQMFVISAPSSPNLLQNGDFEQDANNDSRPDDWTSNSKVTRSNELVHSGSYAMKHTATDNQGYTISQTVTNLEPKAYIFSGYINVPATSDSFTVKIEIRWRNASNTIIRTDTIPIPSRPGGGWLSVAAHPSAPLETTNAEVRLAVSSLNATFYLDDFVLRSAAPPVDTAPPTVIATTPASGATGVAAETSITATFSEAVTGVTTSSFVLTPQGSDTPVAATVNYDAATRTATLDPIAELPANTTYDVALTSGIADGAGNALPPTTWSFTTAAPPPPDTTAPMVTNQTPAPGASGVAVGADVTVVFSEAMSVTTVLNGLSLLDPTAAAVPATVSYDAASQVARLQPSAALLAGTTYTARLDATITDLAGNPLAQAPLSWSFTTAAPPPPDTTPPTVTSTTPAGGATNVSVGASVTASFSEAVIGVSGSTFTLTPAGGAAIAASVSYNAASQVATLQPSAALAPNTTYTAALTAGITDSANNPLAPLGWSFTTAAPSSWSSLDIGTASGGSTNLNGSSLTASGSGNDIWGSADGFRYVYQPASGDLVLTAQLTQWAGGGNSWAKGGLMLRATTAANAANCFVDVTGANGLRMQYRASTGASSVNTSSGISFTAPSPSAPLWLQLRKSGSSCSAYYSTNGASWTQVGATQTIGLGSSYLYGLAVTAHDTTKFATITVGAIGLDGAAPPPPDTTPPTVTSRTPAGGATNVSVGTSVTASFSEAVIGVSGSTFTLAPAGGAAIAASVSYNAASQVATLQPSAALMPNTTYTAALNAGIADSAGNALPPTQWSFTTAAAPPPDTTPPTVVATSPASGASGIAVGANVTATFSEAMDASSITSAAITLTGPSGSVATTVSYDAASQTATLHPSAALLAGTTHTAQVNGVRDLAGNVIAATYTWSFTTAAAPPPSSWSSLDIGTASGGSTTLSGSSVQLSGSGSDIWGSADSFRYVYQPASGDLVLTAQLTQWAGGGNSWAKGGLMLRGSTAANAANCVVEVSGGNGLRMQWRASAGGGSSITSTGISFAAPSPSAPLWLRLAKAGSSCSAYYSTTGTNWTQVGATQTIGLGSSYLYGLAVTAHDTTKLATVTFDAITATGQ